MRYLRLAEAVTGTDTDTLTRFSRIDLLDSALHAPHAGFGNEDVSPSPTQKAAVLAVGIARNHPLPDATSVLPGSP